MNDLLFANLNVKQLDLERARREIAQVPETCWFWDPYRAVWMLPLMTLDGKAGREGTRLANSPSNSQFSWIDYTPISVQEYFETEIFSWLRPLPRIVVLKTPPGAANNEHIDCTRSEFGSLQHKFRLVLSGPIDSLYFITSRGRLFIPDTSLPYIIDGSWPHGMINDSSEEKITICAGAPWTGSSSYPPLCNYISKSDYSLPNDYERYFK